MCVSIYVCVRLFLCVCVCACVCIYVHMYVYVCKCSRHPQGTQPLVSEEISPPIDEATLTVWPSRHPGGELKFEFKFKVEINVNLLSGFRAQENVFFRRRR